MLLSVLGAYLAIGLGVFMMNVRIRLELLPLTLVTIMTTTAGWFFVLSIFAIRLHRMDAFNPFTSAAYIFLMFLSTMFYPLAELPGWFRLTAQTNPMTWQVDLFGFTLLGTGAPRVVLLEAVAFGVFTLVCLAFAVRALDRAA
jgi:ABC-type multidrug transport system permease subunit